MDANVFQQSSSQKLSVNKIIICEIQEKLSYLNARKFTDSLKVLLDSGHNRIVVSIRFSHGRQKISQNSLS